MREAIEKADNLKIPIIVQLKGSAPRIGQVRDDRLTLKSGEEFRLYTNKKQVDYNKGTYCDLADSTHKVNIGDRISLDYGRSFMTVVRYERLTEERA